jgi:hypothetical protein
MFIVRSSSVSGSLRQDIAERRRRIAIEGDDGAAYSLRMVAL